MEEKIKVYVDSNEKDFITDCYLADNTKIICEFYHEESEIEYSNCKLLNLQEYDKQKDQRIAELEQELSELKTKYEDCENERLQNRIEYLTMKNKWLSTEKELAELKEKDNYHLRYELAGADETITNLKKQIEENGKEINTKNNKLAELKKELTICKDTLRRKTQSNRDLQHRVHNVNTQLAIQELEKVKNFVDGRTYCADYIKKRIKELKGE